VAAAEEYRRRKREKEKFNEKLQTAKPNAACESNLSPRLMCVFALYAPIRRRSKASCFYVRFNDSGELKREREGERYK
jgi:hypothetical protein